MTSMLTWSFAVRAEGGILDALSGLVDFNRCYSLASYNSKFWMARTKGDKVELEREGLFYDRRETVSENQIKRPASGILSNGFPMTEGSTLYVQDRRHNTSLLGKLAGILFNDDNVPYAVFKCDRFPFKIDLEASYYDENTQNVVFVNNGLKTVTLQGKQRSVGEVVTVLIKTIENGESTRKYFDLTIDEILESPTQDAPKFVKMSGVLKGYILTYCKDENFVNDLIKTADCGRNSGSPSACVGPSLFSE